MPTGTYPRATLEESFWRRVKKSDACWIWTGATNSDGYGLICRKSPRVRLLAHRYVYTLLVATIPTGMVIDHKCSVRLCVNPSHLDIVTQAENARRSYARGRHKNRLEMGLLGKFQRRKTHCPHGHHYAGANLIIDEQGRRRCRICNNEKSQRYLFKKVKL